MYFTRRRADRAFPRMGIRIEDQTVAWKEQAKYLGVTLDRTLTFKMHTGFVLKKAGQCIRSLYSLLCRKSLLHQKNKLTLFKTTLRPVFAFSSPSWARSLALCQVRRLQVLQNRCLCMCLDRPYHYPTNNLHNEAEVPLLTELIGRLNYDFQQRTLLSDNPLLSTLYDTPTSTSPADPTHDSL